MFRSLIFSAATLALAAQTPAPEAAPKPVAAPATAKPAAAAVKPTAPAAAKAAPKPKVDKVLAKIGTEVIRESDFDLFLSLSTNEQQRMQLQFMPDARVQYLNHFLEFKVLAAKARKDGFHKKPEHAKKMALMDMQVLIQALMEREGPALQAKLALKDEEVKAYFDQNPAKFSTPESFNARHILVATKAKGTEKPLTDEEAKAKIAKIQAELAAGKTFEAAAKEYSDDPGSKDKGGLYENTAFGAFVPEFDAAVRAQEAGKVGQPVKSTFGYHLILVEKITPAVAKTFEAAKESAHQMAAAQRQEQVMKEYMDTLKKEMQFEASAEAKDAAPVKAMKVGK